jgi:protein gp37
MAETTKIGWADATVNFWWGCTEVSPGCDNCYARTLAKRRGVGWGPKADRVTIKGAWDLVARLQRRAEREGRRLRVFPNSMSDFFDAKGPSAIRAAAWEHMRGATLLDFLILTKRPKSIPSMLPKDWGAGYPNVWLGTSVEDQKRADARIPALLQVPAAVRFLSCEPLLGPLDLSGYMGPPEPPALGNAIHWGIVGGESGAGFRGMGIAWLESVVDQFRAAGLPVFAKQDSAYRSEQRGRIPDAYWIHEWPEGVKV